MEELLHKYFGYTEFRPLQREIIEGVLNKKDSFVLMPTGGGKSLCFQLPALMLPGLTVVISPLIALMKDQVDGLIASGVPATFINSSLFQGDVEERMRAIKRGKIKLLYVAPERLVMPSFLEFLKEITISLFAIDEAHCISSWGHEFRADYRQLGSLRKSFPDVPIIGMTATATERVREDIVTQLHLSKDVRKYQASFDRHNLYYSVQPKAEQFEKLLHFLGSHKGECGIIYCLSRKDTESLVEKLQKKGYKALAYHAGLNQDIREENQNAFSCDKVDIICATIAFGMGIDKSNVRFVVHYHLPKNLAGYYQETGRAGRDGLPSDCLLFYTYGDKIKLERFIEQNESKIQRDREFTELNLMLDFAQSHECRRKIILRYFGENYDVENCGACDNCLRKKRLNDSGTTQREPMQPVRMKKPNLLHSNLKVPLQPVRERYAGVFDATREAQMFLSCVKRVNESFGMNHIVDILRGSESQKIFHNRHQELSTYAIGKSIPKKRWSHIALELLREGYVRRDGNNFDVIKLTAKAKPVLVENAKVIIEEEPKTQIISKATSDLPPDHKDLFEKLRTLRKNIADRDNIPPYVIFHDSSLRDMVSQLPKTKTEFLNVLGVGESKADKYGKLFLEEIAAYLREHPIAKLDIPKGHYIAPSESDTSLASYRLYKQGQTPEQIAKSRNIVVSTVMTHLEVYIASGEITDISAFVAEEKIPLIQAALEKYGDAVLYPAMEALGKEKFTYDELKVVRAWVYAGNKGTVAEGQSVKKKIRLAAKTIVVRKSINRSVPEPLRQKTLISTSPKKEENSSWRTFFDQKRNEAEQNTESYRMPKKKIELPKAGNIIPKKEIKLKPPETKIEDIIPHRDGKITSWQSYIDQKTQESPRKLDYKKRPKSSPKKKRRGRYSRKPVENTSHNFDQVSRLKR